MALYEVISNNTFVLSKPSFFSSYLGGLSKGTVIDVKNISGGWANFNFKGQNAYVRSSNLRVVQVVTGSITINYIDAETSQSLASPLTNSELALGTYSYNAISISGYTALEPKAQSITLTSTNANQTLTFKYKKIILGSITVQYIDIVTNKEIASSKSDSNLPLGSYTYTAIKIDGYESIEPTTKVVTLTATNSNETIVFKYKNILGTVTIRYIDADTKQTLLPDDIYSNLELQEYIYTAKNIDNYAISGNNSYTVLLTEAMPNSVITFEYNKIQIPSDLYVIELDKFNIFNNNTEAVKTTKGINDALTYAKEQGYNKVKLPSGDYLIENDNIQLRKTFIDIENETKTWTTNLKGVVLPDNLIFDITNCTLNLEPNKQVLQSVITFANSHNSQLIGGTILGDRDTHLFELIINKNSDELESGDFDINTGSPIVDDTKMRTKNYISTLANGSPLLNDFIICPLANTTMNTVDGGNRYIYCYDKDNNYLGKATGNNSFLTRATLLPNTAKIKVSFRGEKRTDAKYYLTSEKIYLTYEQAYGISIYGSNNITIDGTTSNNFLTDGIITMPFPLNHTNNNLTLKNCTFENNRRQGMSFVGTTDGALLQGCKFGKTQGADPQCGIDFEHYTYVKNVVIDDCDFYDNKKWDIINYNGWDIEIKNCRFNGGIGSTYGYNMNIHNNSFIYFNSPIINKTFKNTVFALNTNKTDAENAYFKINNNYIEGYKSEGGNLTSTLLNSSFLNNTVVNTSIVLGRNSSGNNYTNSIVKYFLCNYKYSNEKLTTSILGGENNGFNKYYRYFDNFELINCTFNGGETTLLNTIFTNSKIYNNTRTFCSSWEGKYTIDTCSILTEYNTNIPFISSQGCESVTFINCTMNLSCTPFVALNYKDFYMSNCTITFNHFLKTTNTMKFYNNVYGTANFDSNTFYKDFSDPKITLPTSTNSIANDAPFTTSITI